MRKGVLGDEVESLMSYSRYCENVSPYLAKQQQWLKNCCTVADNGPKIVHFSHSPAVLGSTSAPKLKVANPPLPLSNEQLVP